jgi:hypothetical protein
VLLLPLLVLTKMMLMSHYHHHRQLAALQVLLSAGAAAVAAASSTTPAADAAPAQLGLQTLLVLQQQQRQQLLDIAFLYAEGIATPTHSTSQQVSTIQYAKYNPEIASGRSCSAAALPRMSNATVVPMQRLHWKGVIWPKPSRQTPHMGLV